VIYGLAVLPALATAAGVTTLLPESPRWLLLRGGGEASARDKALGALTRLRGTYADSFIPCFTMSSDATSLRFTLRVRESRGLGKNLFTCRGA
jgi:hypothetical protein